MTHEEIIAKVKENPFKLIRVKDDEGHEFLVVSGSPIINNESAKGHTEMSTSIVGIREDGIKDSIENMQNTYKAWTGKDIDEVDWTPLVV